MLGRCGMNIVPTFVFLPFGERAKMQVVKPAAVSVLTLLLPTDGKSLPSKAITTCLSLSEKAETAVARLRDASLLAAS